MTKLHTTKLNYFFHSGKIHTNILFIQNLIYLINKKVLKLEIIKKTRSSFTYKEIYISPDINFDDYHPEEFEINFISSFTVTTRKISIEKLIELNISKKWEKTFLKNINNSSREPFNKIKFRKENYESKYFDFHNLNSENLDIDQKSKPKRYKLFILDKIEFDTELIDVMFDKTIDYMTSKNKGKGKINWGLINASAGI